MAAEVVVEKSTGIQFHQEVTVLSDETPYVLSGTAVRTKKVMGMLFRAYAVGFYISKKATGLLKWSEGDLDDEFFSELAQKHNPKVVRLVLARDIPVEKMQAAFEEVLFPRIDSLGGDRGVVKDMVKAMVGSARSLKNSTEIIFAMEDSKLTLFYNGEMVYSASSSELCDAVSDLYLGKSSIVPELRGTFKDLMPQVFHEIQDFTEGPPDDTAEPSANRRSSVVTVTEPLELEEDGWSQPQTPQADIFADADYITADEEFELDEDAILVDDDPFVNILSEYTRDGTVKLPFNIGFLSLKSGAIFQDTPISPELPISNPSKYVPSTTMEGTLHLEVGGFTGPLSGRRNFAVRGPLTGKRYFEKWIKCFFYWDGQAPTDLLYWVDREGAQKVKSFKAPGKKGTSKDPLPLDADGRIRVFGAQIKKAHSGIRRPLTGKGMLGAGGGTSLEILVPGQDPIVVRAPTNEDMESWFRCLAAAASGKSEFQMRRESDLDDQQFV